MSRDEKQTALVPTISADELREQVDAEMPSLVGGFQPGPRRLSRIGKLHLGYKKTTNRNGRDIEYPAESSWFVFEDCEIEQLVVAQARNSDVISDGDGVAHTAALEIIFPCNRINENVEIAYAMYNSKRQLLCTSKDGITKRCMNADTGEFTEGECLNENCPFAQADGNKAAACGQVMRIRFILPSVPGLGVWQLDTRSKWSMSSVLGYMRTLKAEITRGQLAGIRLRLYRASEMIPDKHSKALRQHWPLHLVCPLTFDEYGAELNRARTMTYNAADVEDFDQEAAEDLFVNGGGLPEEETPDPKGPAIVDEDTGEILLPEEAQEAELVPESEPQDEATGEPPAPAPEPKPEPAKPTPMINTEQVNAIFKLAERTWTDRATAAASLKAWLAQTFDGKDTVRKLTYQEASKAIVALSNKAAEAARAGRTGK